MARALRYPTVLVASPAVPERGESPTDSMGIMSSNFRRTITFALSSSLLVACAAEPLVSSDTQAGTFPNGTFPNGTFPNGTFPNGTFPNGTFPNGVSLGGASPTGTSASGAPIHAAPGTSGAAPLTGAGVVGSTWTGALTGGSSVLLRIDAASRLTGANADIWAYAISVEANGAWYPLCGADASGAPHLATTSQGAWNLAQGVPGGGSYHPDAAQFTIACRGSTIAKCVEMGYKPWLGYTDELAACSRAMRGDYCGDGTPYTVNGTLVNLYDDVGVQLDDQAWRPEAEWTPDGARCISNERATRFHQVAHQRPSCFPAQLAERGSCGRRFDGGATLITELPRR